MTGGGAAGDDFNDDDDDDDPSKRWSLGRTLVPDKDKQREKTKRELDLFAEAKKYLWE